MKNLKNLKSIAFATTMALALASCRDNENSTIQEVTKNNVTLSFSNVVNGTEIKLGDATTANAFTSNGQTIKFGEVKYVISNIILVKADGTEVPYNIDDLDKGATVVNLSKSESLNYVLSDIPAGDYQRIKFGLGVKTSLNTLDQEKFPKFYAAAGANDTQMHWEWGNGYRFTKLEGFFGDSDTAFSIHTGSTVKGTKNDPSTYTQGVDAFRSVELSLPKTAVVGTSAPKITIVADFDKLLNGTNKITLEGNIPAIHNTDKMVPIVDNLGGNNDTDKLGMFSVSKVEN